MIKNLLSAISKKPITLEISYQGTNRIKPAKLLPAATLPGIATFYNNSKLAYTTMVLLEPHLDNPKKPHRMEPP